MARPGLKMPPRHAVVVRVGNAPASSDIPVARSSAPPPPPVEREAREHAPIASSDKVTVRALPSPRPPSVRPGSERATPPLSTLLPPAPDSPLPAWSPRRLESFPPPSDAPVATSVRGSTAPDRVARGASRWPIVLAAAIGLLLGVVSIATSTSARRGFARAPAAQPAPEPALQPLPSASSEPLLRARPAAMKPREAQAETVPAPSSRPAQAAPVPKKTIF